jgi:uncharacterized damage-inducible protein DinB
MALTDALLPEFDHEMAVTRTLLSRVPDGVFDWKPHPKSMSLGQLAQHIATLPLWGLVTLTQPSFDVAGNPPLAPSQTRADVLALFDGHVAQARAALVGIDDAALMTPWALKQGPQTIFSMPKAGVWRSFVMSHLIHHRAQLSVYLRMHDVPLPAMYGPTADERPS